MSRRLSWHDRKWLFLARRHCRPKNKPTTARRDWYQHLSKRRSVCQIFPPHHCITSSRNIPLICDLAKHSLACVSYCPTRQMGCLRSLICELISIYTTVENEVEHLKGHRNRIRPCFLVRDTRKCASDYDIKNSDGCKIAINCSEMALSRVWLNFIDNNLGIVVSTVALRGGFFKFPKHITHYIFSQIISRMK